MTSLTLNDDGTATVRGFSARSFVMGSSHGQLNVLSLNAVATACALFAREHLWLSYVPPSALPEGSSVTADGSVSPDGITLPPLAEKAERRLFEMEENGAESQRKTTFFLSVACVDLMHPSPAEAMKEWIGGAPPLSFTRCLLGVVALAHVGKSSVGFRVDIFGYTEGSESSSKQHLGRFRFLRVHVDKVKRMVSAMPAYQIDHLQNVLSRTRAAVGSETFEAYGIPRVDIKNMIALSASRWTHAVDGTPAARRQAQPSPQALEESGSHSLLVDSYRRRHHLRESDFDYNLHCNSTQLSQLIIDAFRGACGDTRCLLSRIVPQERPSSIAADLLIRELRIDFVKEIPMSVEGLDIHLFPSSSEEAHRIIEGYAAQHLYTYNLELYVVCRVLPSKFDSTEDMYPCTVGIMKVAV